MLLMLIIGWIVVVPALVVGGLLLASAVLGRRARRLGGVDVGALAREIAGFAHFEPSAPNDAGPVRTGAPAAERTPLASAY